MNNQKAVLYDVRWQALRVQLLGSFVHPIKIHRNIDKLNAYLSEVPENSQEKFNRLWRILNLLNGTRMGFHGMGITGTSQDKILVEYRDKISKEYKNYQKAGFEFKDWDWDKVEKDLEKLKDKNDIIFTKIYKNLITRTKQAHRKVGTMKHRNELSTFIGLMEKI
jgi:hypothetical protein